MSKYKKGRRWEYKVRDHFKSQGWLVIRAAGSKPLDLVCLKQGKKPALVECKTKNYLTKSEKEKLLGMAKQADATPILVFNDNGTPMVKVIT